MSDLPPVEMSRDADGPQLPPEQTPPPTLRPTTSFTERYRGSAYGAPQPPASTPEPRGNRTLVIVGVGILIVALVAGGAWLFLGQRQPLPPPARTADVAALRGEQTMGSFRAWVADTAGIVFHENLDETVSAQAFGGLIKGDLDVVGADFSGTIQFTDGKILKAGDVVDVENIGYARLPGKAWVQSPELVPYQSPDPFLAIDRTQPIYDLGLETRAGQAVYHLRITDWIFGDPNVYLNAPAGTLKVTDTRFDIWVTEAGVPVAAQVDADLTAVQIQTQIPVALHTVYTMTNVGDQIVITAPVLSPAPSRSAAP